VCSSDLIKKGFYVNFTPYISLVNGFKKTNKSHYLSTFYLTPRYELSWFEFGLPLSVNTMEGFQAGMNVRLGPLFFGTDNLLSQLFGKKTFTSEHAYAGLRIPIAYRKPKDKDGDGVSDAADQCPDKPGTLEMMGCPDSDGDGLSDSDDRCPEEFGMVALNGCPELDADADGIKDDADKCPDTPGIEAYGGCPFLDTDGDGIADEDDQCPAEFGLAEYQGCKKPIEAVTLMAIGIPPEQDSDNDSIPDTRDACPLTYGPLSNNGCPEIAAEEQEIIDMAFENLEFEIASPKMKVSSFQYMNNLAELIKSKPDWVLGISGHTDNIGSREFNLELSRDRANTVKDFLVSAGVEESRLQVSYFGPDKPIASNDTMDGRKQNRRVELNILFD